MAAPITGARTVPGRARLILAVSLTIIIAPLIETVPVVDPFSIGAVLIIVQQIIIGFAIGFVFQLIFSAIITGGQIIAMQMGLGFASMVDPQNGAQVPVLSQLYLIMTTLLFLTMNGHLLYAQLLVDSFTVIPISSSGLMHTSFFEIAKWGSNMFAAGLWLALPALASLLTVNMAFGVMARAAPQLNIFVIGFPLTMIMGFLVVLYSLPAVVTQFSSILSDGLDLINILLLR